MKLLLIEDDTTIAMAVKRGLEGEGFTVEVAVDGVDGLWMATEGSYDALIVDLMLPGKNGFTICRELREQQNWTPILVLTAKEGDLDEAEALDTGADDYLTKPFPTPSSSPACAPCCAGPRARARLRSPWVTSVSTPVNAGSGGATSRSHSRPASSRSSSS